MTTMAMAVNVAAIIIAGPGVLPFCLVYPPSPQARGRADGFELEVLPNMRVQDSDGAVLLHHVAAQVRVALCVCVCMRVCVSCMFDRRTWC